ncbi:polysaccharide pyruvyl transferase family protein [Paenibacillus senegalensis]|uniref:polysaccharide pyruvyl transferase family protein n=1 Tax=Paenibacillus senegalensis TaxID=1465766 RepID=UPI0002886DBD|nr:polysaccharide pyruvyl transferase family protein [Paenibacillus senegalensis]
MKKVLYIGWIGYRNLGDELMFDLFKQKASELGNTYAIDVVNNEQHYLANAPLASYDLIVLGGGSVLSGPQRLIDEYVIDALLSSVSLGKKTMIWGSGIDWVPRSYIPALANNDELFLPVSAGWKDKVREVFKACAWAGVRGPYTLSLLERLGVKHEHVELSGDPAFLLMPDMSKVEKRGSLSGNQPIIGVNWGTTFNRLYGADELKVEDELAQALQELLRQGYAVYFYLLWNADREATERLYARIRGSGTVVYDPTLYNQNELMSLLQDFSFTINFKLHSNYLSLAAAVPFIALGYRFKVFDFAKSVELEDYVVPTDSEQIKEHILTLEEQLASERTQIVEKMASHRNQYAKRISEPFELGLFV